MKDNTPRSVFIDVRRSVDPQAADESGMFYSVPIWDLWRVARNNMAATLTCGRVANEVSRYLYVYGSNALWTLAIFKIIFSSTEKRKSYRFGTTCGWVVNDRIFIFGWINPFKVVRFDLFWQISIWCQSYYCLVLTNQGVHAFCDLIITVVINNHKPNQFWFKILNQSIH